jgi:hypothetical protein
MWPHYPKHSHLYLQSCKLSKLIYTWASGVTQNRWIHISCSYTCIGVSIFLLITKLITLVFLKTSKSKKKKVTTIPSSRQPLSCPVLHTVCVCFVLSGWVVWMPSGALLRLCVCDSHCWQHFVDILGWHIWRQWAKKVCMSRPLV